METTRIKVLEYRPDGRRGRSLRRILKWLGWGVAALATLVSILVAATIFLTPTGWTPDIPFDHNAATGIASQIAGGALQPDADGIVKLPPGTKALSRYDEVYVTRDSSGVIWVLFRTSQGHGIDLRGYLYRSTPTAGPTPATLRVLGPTIGKPPTEKIDYFVDHQVDANWYQVYMNLN